MPHLELDVMAKMATLLEPLDQQARGRAMLWLIQSLEIELPQIQASKLRMNSAASAPSNSASSSYETLADLFHAASPRTDREKALVAAYWIQTSKEVSQFASQEVNSELKHLGFGVSNITDALTQLMNEKPSLVIQLKKSGNSKQARKTYKVTDAGNRKVEEILSGKGE